MKSVLTLITVIAFTTGCSEERKLNNTDLENSLASNDNSPIISVEPSENVNLEDYWEEAAAIKSEAEQILNEAKKLRCNEALVFAENAILTSGKTSACKDFSQAEQLLGEAGEIVQNAENALVQCQDQNEQIY